MSKLAERRDLLIKEAEGLQEQFKEASGARQKAEVDCQELTAQFNDRNSRINELNILIQEEKAAEEVDVPEGGEACPA